MKYMYYLQNGIAVSLVPEGYDRFYIAENLKADTMQSKFFYPGDSIQYELDLLCVTV